MPKPEATPALKNPDRRLANTEQILPTLATREELHAAIAAAVAPLATRYEVRAEEVETRRHFNVAFELMRAEIRVFAARRR
jgi:malic enzyme